jgi:hypothetical protein
MKSIQLNIPTPCHEKLGNMKATTLGNYCFSCNKEVVDFTKMSDDSIINYLSKNKASCGTFKQSQLDRRLYSNASQTKQNPFKYFLASLISFNIFSINAKAIDKNSIVPDTILVANDSNKFQFDSTIFNKLIDTPMVKISTHLVVDSNIFWNPIPPYNPHDIITSGGIGGYFETRFPWPDIPIFTNIYVSIMDTFPKAKLKIINLPKFIFWNDYTKFFLPNKKNDSNEKPKHIPEAILSNTVSTEKKKWFYWW